MMEIMKRSGHIKTVEVLIKYSADVKAKDKDGKTASMIASEYGHTDIAELLRQVENRYDEESSKTRRSYNNMLRLFIEFFNYRRMIWNSKKYMINI